jgi:hypothetical protein
MLQVAHPFYVFYRKEALEVKEGRLERNKTWMMKTLQSKVKAPIIELHASQLLQRFRTSYTAYYVLFCEVTDPDWDVAFRSLVDDGVTVNMAFLTRTIIRLHNVLAKEKSSVGVIVCFVAAYLTYYRRVTIEQKSKPPPPPPIVKDEVDVMVDGYLGAIV